MPRLNLVIFVLLGAAAACAEAERTRSTPTGRDAGVSATDSGTATDGGSNPGDAGSQTPDAGSEPDDLGWFQIDGIDATTTFTRITGTGPNDIYLLGDVDGVGSQVLHYDGTGYTEVTVELDRCERAIDDIGIAPNGDLVAYAANCAALARRTNGVWNLVSLDTNNTRNTRELWVGPDVYWVTGFGNTLEIELDGTTTDRGGLNLGGTVSVSGTARDDVYVGGVLGMGYYDGQRYSRIGGGRRVFAHRPGEIWQIAHDDSSNRFQIILWDGVNNSSWNFDGDAPGGRIHANGDQVWASAARGLVHQLVHGAAFVEHRMPEALPRIGQVFIAGEEDVWFAGQEGTIVRYARPSNIAEAKTALTVESDEVPPPIEPRPGMARLRLVNASGEGVRFCSSLNGSLTTRPLMGNETTVGYFDVPIPNNPSVLNFRAWIESSDGRECANGGINANRKSVWMTGDENVTIAGTLFPEDEITIVKDTFGTLTAGTASLEVVSLSGIAERFDTCRAGTPLGSGRSEVPSTTTEIELHDAATPPCSGVVVETLRITLADATHHTIVLGGPEALLCTDATGAVGQDFADCVVLR